MQSSELSVAAPKQIKVISLVSKFNKF